MVTQRTFPLITDRNSKAIDAVYIIEELLTDLTQEERSAVIAFINSKFPEFRLADSDGAAPQEEDWKTVTIRALTKEVRSLQEKLESRRCAI